jgi:hypothetical protein
MKKIYLFLFLVMTFSVMALPPINEKPNEKWFSGDTKINPLYKWLQEADQMIEAGVLLGTGNVYYVDSGVTTEGNGNTWATAKNTLDEAIDLCTDDNGDVILIAQGHAENLSGAGTVTCDKSGVTIIGCGNGELRPTFTTTATDGTFLVSDDSVKIYGLRFVPGISAVVTAISVSATGDSFTMTNCEFVNPGTATYEYITMVTLASGSDYVTISGNNFVSTVTSTGCSEAIKAGAGVVNRLSIVGNEFQGAFIVSPIWSDQINTNCLVADNTIHQATTGQFGIEFTAAATGNLYNNTVYTDGATTAIDPGSLKSTGPNWIVSAIDKSPVMFPAQDDTAENLIGVNDADNAAVTSAVVANKDGSILERQETIQVSDSPNKNHPNYFTVTADMTSSTWNTAAAHEIATVTGACRVQILVEVTATIVTTGTNGTIALGFEGNASAMFSATALDAAVTGDVFSAVYGSAATTPASGAEYQSALTHCVFDVVSVTGKDIGYTIATNAATTGTLTFHVWWTPLDSTGAVTAGAGGTL